MSYRSEMPVNPTTGWSNVGFRRALDPSASRMQYHRAAAGPRFVASDGFGNMVDVRRSQVPWNLQGVGQMDLVAGLLGAGEQAADQFVTGIINRNWPVLEAKLDKSLLPVKLLLVQAVGAAGVAAAYSVMTYNR